VKGKGKLGPLSVIGVVRELRRRGGDPRPLSVAGARELVPVLARELRAGGEASAVVENVLENVSVLVWVGAPDADQLHTADQAGVPIVAVTDADDVPYVLATSIVRVPPGRASRSARSHAPSPTSSVRTARRSPRAYRSCAARCALT
jgi:hypothetical protein